jgi:thiol:disulfide interchange protein
MKRFLVATAVLEFGAGLGLLAAPSVLAMRLLGAPLDTPAALAVARLGGVALLALATACWLARQDGQSHVARVLVAAIHAAMAVWCIAILSQRTSAPRAESER